MVKPNSRSRKSYYSASDDDEKSNPQFFKIFIPRHCSKHLRIPPAFIKYFKGVSPSKSILKTCAKTSWCIDVNKVGNYFFFQKGWLEFVRDNSLESGDFLIFCYTGNSEFYVPIFGKNNCRKEVPICTRDSDKLQPVHQGSGTVEASKSKAKIYVDSTVEIGTTRMPIQENSEAVGAPFEFGSKKAFFEAVLKPAYIYAGFLHIPSEFVKSYMSTHSQTARLNHSSKSWLVKLIRRGNSLVFSCGWGKFVADNTLKKGDVCSFELIGRNDYAFNVVIVRGNGTTPKKAQGTETTRPSSGREEGKSKAKIYVDSTVEIGTTRMPIQENIEAVGAPFKFGSKKAFFEAVLKPAYIYAGFLHIPLEFVKNYMSTHSQSARLNHSSKSWLVKLIRYGKGLVFSCGWRKFVADNTLKEGDVCSFELIGRNDYAFNVAIVRGNGTPNKAQGTKTTRHSSSREEGKSKDMEGLTSKEEGSKRRLEANIEDTSSKFISKHPFFQIVLSATYVSRPFMNIPWNFRKSHMSERRENAKLQLSNKWWVVNLKGYDCSRGYNFCGGWTKFVKENDLQVGDVCTFEMIEKEKYVFKVSIARGVNNGNPTEA